MPKTLMQSVVSQLQKERRRLEDELHHVTAALTAFGNAYVSRRTVIEISRQLSDCLIVSMLPTERTASVTNARSSLLRVPLTQRPNRDYQQPRQAHPREPVPKTRVDRPHSFDGNLGY